jgi:hypothetical protein
MQGQTGAVWSRAAPTQHRRPENLATRQRQPQPLRRAIPTLTGAVLVVNAPMGEQQRPAPLTGG